MRTIYGVKVLVLTLCMLFQFSAANAETPCQGTTTPVVVSSPAQFQSALQVAVPGATIKLRSGNYTKLTVNKSGSATRPIYIIAENLAVGTNGQPKAGAHSNVSSLIMAANNISVCGLYFDRHSYISIKHEAAADNITYQQNYFDTGVMNKNAVEYSINTWEGGTNLDVRKNYFSAKKNNVYSQDYGVALFKYNGVRITGNTFDGVFNHDISLKQSVSNVVIRANTFKGCGQVCIHAGQTQDFKGDGDNTGGRLVISDNLFTEAYTSHPESASRKVLVLRNQKEILVTGNRFRGAWTKTIVSDFINKGGLKKVQDREMGIWGVRQNSIRILNNEFQGARLAFSGRGTGEEDHINLSNNSGSFSCSTSAFQAIPGKKYVWSTIDLSPPTVTGCH